MSEGGVAVVGLGVICGLGAGLDALRAGVLAARCALRPLDLFELEACAPVAVAPVAAGEGARTHRLAVAAALEAAASLDLRACPPHRRAVVLGTTTGGIELGEAWLLKRAAGLDPDPTPLRWHPPYTVTQAVAEALDARGPRLTLSTACSSGANALLVAQDLLHQGEADVVFAGGAEGLARTTYQGFANLRLMSSTPCRPFDADRDGLSLGEAGAILALARPTSPWAPKAWLLGGACTCDAHHITAPAPDGAAVIAALRGALARAELAPSRIAYINAHATATPANDAVEASALRAVFGDGVAVSGSKSALGHTLGAAGALEAVLCALAVSEGLRPATLNTRRPAPGAPSGLILGQPQRAATPYALSTSFAFGGNNAALIFGSV
ncbi:beta-ketoacyl-[acyl-carrier-protein] synthase family protein [Myxococcota bacterium]|nr:beta-ketoacyl-[acyl-carrier-protein] synthase family protein [Myxococcota bacterium]MBU1431615.1 beta-ketoacyl-[acyl-carrier-protein] synthase family protein [Myxococcota bacterium]